MAGDDDRVAEFEAFCREQWASALRLARVLAGPSVDDEQAEALVIDALAETFERWGGDDPSAQLRRLVVARCVAAERRRPGGHERTDDDAEPYAPLARPSPLEALAELPVRQRAAIVLRHHDGLVDHDIADAVGVADGKVDPLIAGGMARLREVTGR